MKFENTINKCWKNAMLLIKPETNPPLGGSK